uniref:Ubiquitin carboxyl-terminal hydrolase n=1 Tax=Parascaris univalens TaxID=6257 RepID=A0A915BR66_PARUN
MASNVAMSDDGKENDGSPSASDAVADAMNGEVKETIVCVHKNKRGLFKSSEVRKKLKANLKKNANNDLCEDCVRAASKSPFPGVWLCVSCGYAGCEGSQHAQKHCKAARSGAEHPLFFSVSGGTFRCFMCEVNLNSSEENTQPMKSFLNEYNSFMKTKSKSADQLSLKAHSNEESTSASSALDKGTLKKEKDKKATEKYLPGSTPKKEDRQGFVAVKGLVNLGNTCFFNSIVQCLLHTHSLSIYVNLVGKQEYVDIPSMKVVIADRTVQVPHVRLDLEPFKGPLNEHFAYFLRDFRMGRAIHPSSLFSEIAKKAPRFRGWAQQDAHELLRYLLDGLRSEELSRYKEAISDHLRIPKNINPRSVEPHLVAFAKGMLKGCGRPLLDAVFGGTLLQTVKCSKCGHLSRTFEEMLDLSLPLPSTSTGRSMFSATTRMHKSASATLSKHQKKKEKANARKKNRRRSHGETVMVGMGECSAVVTDIAAGIEVPNIDDDDDDDDDANSGAFSSKDGLCEQLRSLDISDDIDECSLVLGDAPPEETGWTLSACLREFTAAETLSAPNAYECEKCCLPYNKKICNGMKKKSVEASKRYLIYEPPAVLTLHFKRFEQTHSESGRVSTRKVSGHIAFPAIFDLAPFCTRIAKRVTNGSREVVYSLYGVVSHSGDLSGGHYVAYVRSRPQSPCAKKFFSQAAHSSLENCELSNGTDDAKSTEISQTEGAWYYASDTRVSVVPESRVLAAEAYILFYERVL